MKIALISLFGVLWRPVVAYFSYFPPNTFINRHKPGSAATSPPAGVFLLTLAVSASHNGGGGSPASQITRASATNFHPVVLDQFYQRQFVDYRPTESWAQVPRGETNFDGVPFLMFGKIDLTGLGSGPDGVNSSLRRVGEIPVLGEPPAWHLGHGASYDSPDGTPIACVRLRYQNGETRRLFIRYGVHARNWYVEARKEIRPE